ncbi:MAG: ATP-binding protein [Rhodocyclaceae bacterium]|nr:ATP-binding protein [Rhodocyclaceae bacterium]MDZ4213463.1 ATP-binding protein [Rhodocyclaceae bacterium]
MTGTDTDSNLLVSSDDRFRIIYDAINDAIFVHDPVTGHVLDANARACAMYGYTREQLLTLDVPRLSANVPPYTLVEVQRLMTRCMEKGWEAFEWLARDSQDRQFWVAVNLKMLMLNGEQRVLAVVRDIDKSKKTEETLQHALTEAKALNAKLTEAHNQLLQSEKMASIGQLAAGVAHELNNPIGFVHSNLGTLKTYLDDIFQIAAVCEAAAAEAGNPEDFARIQTIKAEKDFDFLKTDVYQLLAESTDGLQRVKKIVQDLKDFSRPGEAEWQWADLNKGIESTLNIVWNELKYKCTVKKEYGELHQVRCLAAQLNQVFMNLLINAAQAIETKGEIVISTCALDADTVQIKIADSGKGITPVHMNRLFEPFFTTKPVGKGTGLGLSIAWSIIEKHHGKIEVASEVGKGTTFTITLPVAPPEDNKQVDGMAG